KKVFLAQRRKAPKKTPWKRGSALRLCAFAREILFPLHSSVVQAAGCNDAGGHSRCVWWAASLLSRTQQTCKQAGAVSSTTRCGARVGGRNLRGTERRDDRRATWNSQSGRRICSAGLLLPTRANRVHARRCTSRGACHAGESVRPSSET